MYASRVHASGAFNYGTAIIPRTTESRQGAIFHYKGFSRSTPIGCLLSSRLPSLLNLKCIFSINGASFFSWSRRLENKFVKITLSSRIVEIFLKKETQIWNKKPCLYHKESKLIKSYRFIRNWYTLHILILITFSNFGWNSEGGEMNFKIGRKDSSKRMKRGKRKKKLISRSNALINRRARAN